MTSHTRDVVCVTLVVKRSAKGHPFKTVYVCKFCPSQPVLHPYKCFQVCHTCLDYANVWETFLNYSDILYLLVFFEVMF